METTQNQLEKAPEKITIEQKSPNEDRMVMLSDGIFAIATTLVVLDIKIPAGISTAAGFLSALQGDFAVQTFIYALTFSALYWSWVNHRIILSAAKRIDGMFILLNFLFLGLVAYFPVTSSTVTEYGEYGEAVVMYTLVLAASGFISWFMWVWAIKQQTSSEQSFLRQFATFRTYSLLVTPSVFLLSLLLLLIPGFKSSNIYYSWTSIVILQVIGSRIARMHAARVSSTTSPSSTSYTQK